ncbi:hypothetical protein [Tenacibaculum phage JQ]|nr:hypothetical protein [Tenacibaculum phage JQ]
MGRPKLDLKFIDCECSETFIKVEVSNCREKIFISGNTYGENFGIFLDKSTAIKFNRVMRAEISEINRFEKKRKEGSDE